MAGGGFVAADSSARDYGERVTFSVVMTCLMAASCGIIYGYDNGISGAYSESRRYCSTIHSSLNSFLLATILLLFFGDALLIALLWNGKGLSDVLLITVGIDIRALGSPVSDFTDVVESEALIGHDPSGSSGCNELANTPTYCNYVVP
ncbi:hypothetical protein EJB05_13467, partial [Eragrostis curvula]